MESVERTAKTLDGVIGDAERAVIVLACGIFRRETMRKPSRGYGESSRGVSHLMFLASDPFSTSCIASTALGFSSSADYPPNDQQIAFHEELKEELTDAKSRLDALLRTEVSGFNRLLREKNVPDIINSVY